MGMKRTSLWTLLLLLAHAFVLNILYVSRHDLSTTLDLQSQFNEGRFQGKPWDYLRLYYSHISDESYYYEWSTLVLGKKFEASYPLKERSGSPVNPYFEEAEQKHWPYLQIPSEYPPLLMLPMLLARAMSQSYLGFCHALAILLSALYFAAFYCCYQINVRLKLGFSLNRLLGLSLLSLLLLGQIFVTRLDILPAFIYVWSVYLFLRERTAASGIAIALGFFTKGFTLILLPFFLIDLWGKSQWRRMAALALPCAALMGLGIAGLHASTQGAYWDSFRFHQARGIQVESFYALPAHLANLFHYRPLFTYYGHNSANILGPAHAFLFACTRYLPMLLFGFFYLLAALEARPRRIDGKDEGLWLLRGAVLLLMLFMASFKVFSPQYLIWLVPLYFVACKPCQKRVGLFLAMLALTQVFYPTLYTLIENAQPIGSWLLLLRNGIFLLLTLLVFLDWKTAGAERKA